MSVADLENEFEQLWRLLGKIKYNIPPSADDTQLPKDLFRSKLMKGTTSRLLPIIHHALLLYSTRFADYLVHTKDYKIYGQSDTRFTDEVYRMLRNEFHYNPALQSSQFLTIEGYAKQKLQLVSQIIKLVLEKESLLKKQARTQKMSKKPWHDTNLSKKINQELARHKEAKEAKLQKTQTETRRKDKDMNSKKSRQPGSRSKKSSATSSTDSLRKLRVIKSRRGQSQSSILSHSTQSSNNSSHTSSRADLSDTDPSQSSQTSHTSHASRDTLDPSGPLQNKVETGPNASKTTDTNIAGVPSDGSSFCQIRSNPPVPIASSATAPDASRKSKPSDTSKIATTAAETGICDPSVSPRLRSTMVENEEKASELSDSELFEPLSQRVTKGQNASKRSQNFANDSDASKTSKNAQTASNAASGASAVSGAFEVSGALGSNPSVPDASGATGSTAATGITRDDSKDSKNAGNATGAQEEESKPREPKVLRVDPTNAILSDLKNYEPLQYQNASDATFDTWDPKLSEFLNGSSWGDSSTFFAGVPRFGASGLSTRFDSVSRGASAMSTIAEHGDRTERKINDSGEGSVQNMNNILNDGGGASGSNLAHLAHSDPSHLSQASHASQALQASEVPNDGRKADLDKNGKSQESGRNDGKNGLQAESPRLIGITPSQSKYNELLRHDPLGSFGADFGLGSEQNLFETYGTHGTCATRATHMTEPGAASGREAKEDLDAMDDDDVPDLTVRGKGLFTTSATGTNSGFGGALGSNELLCSSPVGPRSLGTGAIGGIGGIGTISGGVGTGAGLGGLGGLGSGLGTPPKRVMGVSDTYISSETTQVMFATILSRMDNLENTLKDYAERTDARLTIMEGKIEFLESKQKVGQIKQNVADMGISGISGIGGISGISGISGIDANLKDLKKFGTNAATASITASGRNGREGTVGSPRLVSSLTPVVGSDGIGSITTSVGAGGDKRGDFGQNAEFGMSDAATVNSTFVGRYQSGTLRNNINFLNGSGGSHRPRPPKSPFLDDAANERMDAMFGSSAATGTYQSYENTQNAPLHFMQWPISGNENEKRLGKSVGDVGGRKDAHGLITTDDETHNFVNSIKQTIDEANDLLRPMSENM